MDLGGRRAAAVASGVMIFFALMPPASRGVTVEQFAHAAMLAAAAVLALCSQMPNDGA